jgi:hypothetical protein
MWLTSTNAAKLKNFLATGPKVELLLEAASEDAAIDLGGEITPTFEIGADGGDINGRTQTKVPALPSDPSLDAELKIPPAWKTVDRVLDVLLWTTHKQAAKGNNNRRKSQGRGEKKADDDDNANVDDGVDENTQDEEDSIEKERAAAFNEGEQPPDDLTETVEEWEKRTKNKLQTEHIKYVVWAFIKWGDLAYDQGSRTDLVVLYESLNLWYPSFLGLTSSSWGIRLLCVRDSIQPFYRLSECYSTQTHTQRRKGF